MAWIITKDHEDPDKLAEGKFGPSHIQIEAKDILEHPNGLPFQMKDDDGVLYYEGIYAGPNTESLFSPLDDFGSPNAGATTILYRHDKDGKLGKTGEFKAI